jgi:DNA invertase Pin-like site-specific DNA recombinase
MPTKQTISHGEMIRMREAGFTYAEIAQRSGVPYGTVRSRMQRWKVRPRVKVIHSRNRPPMHKFPYWLIYEMYWECELSTNEIAYELGLKRNTVGTLMRRLGIPTRTRAQAWEVQKKRGRMPLRKPWTAEQAREMARRANRLRGNGDRDRSNGRVGG